ncbi:MAG: hypothetical protein M1840_003193 [Geoglossum simile]|nr:MAG: hypothetical protein M1840_003193 [Geoglossum simile]
MESADGLQVAPRKQAAEAQPQVASTIPVQIQGVINLEAEYWIDEEQPIKTFIYQASGAATKKLFGMHMRQPTRFSKPRLRKYSETYQITTDERTSDIIARKVKEGYEVAGALPYRYTLQSWRTAKRYIAWSDANITCSPLNDAGEMLLEKENGTWHIGLGLIHALLYRKTDANFEAVNFRSIGKGLFGSGIAEGWAVEVGAARKRNALRNEPRDGRVVWRVKTDIDERVCIKWDDNRLLDA